MFGTHDLALFAFTALVLAATPGVDLVFTLTRTLQFGVAGGFAAACGISAGCIVHTFAAAFGLAALLAASSTAFNTVKWAGAIYLLWLAWGMFRNARRAPGGASLHELAAGLPDGGGSVATTHAAPRVAGSSGEAGVATLGAIFRPGLLTNTLNPKVALFFLAVLPQFIAADAAHETSAFLFLGAWFVAQGTLFLLLFVFLVASLRRMRASPLLQRGLHVLGGTLFTLIAARLVSAQGNLAR